MRINQNKLARIVTLKEGLEESVSIALVKEVQKITFQVLASHKASEIMQLIERYRL